MEEDEFPRRRKRGRARIWNRRCIFCNKKFVGSTHIIDHIRKHINERPFPCKFCGFAFIQNSHLRDHQEVYENGQCAVIQEADRIRKEQQRTCPICNKVFSSLQNRKRHQKFHEDETVLNVKKLFTCDLCGDKMPRSSLGPHRLEYHPDNFYRRSGNRIERRRSSRPPKKSESRKRVRQNLSKIAKDVNGYKESDLSMPFLCGICDETFKNLSELNEHEKSHLEATTDVDLDLNDPHPHNGLDHDDDGQDKKEKKKRRKKIKFKCDFCPERFLAVERLEKHFEELHKGNVDVEDDHQGEESLKLAKEIKKKKKRKRAKEAECEIGADATATEMIPDFDDDVHLELNLNENEAEAKVCYNYVGGPNDDDDDDERKKKKERRRRRRLEKMKIKTENDCAVRQELLEVDDTEVLENHFDVVDNDKGNVDKEFEAHCEGDGSLTSSRKLKKKKKGNRSEMKMTSSHGDSDTMDGSLLIANPLEAPNRTSVSSGINENENVDSLSHGHQKKKRKKISKKSKNEEVNLELESLTTRLNESTPEKKKKKKRKRANETSPPGEIGNNPKANASGGRTKVRVKVKSPEKVWRHERVIWC